ncbi:hypothetical protein SEVIR_2G059600v4 [Setaria viridis]|nr:uncharacterized protein LOC117843315 isoform X2 [Setaria viridis]
MHPAARLARRPAPPAAASMAPPSPSPHRRAPLFRPPELPLPSALVPPKKRRVMRTPPKATTPIPPPPPPVPAAARDLAVPAPTPPPRADPVGSPPAADQKPTLPPPPRAATKPSLPPPPTAENPSSPPPLTTEKPSSLPPPPAAEDENPSAPPPPATEKPSSPPTPPTDAPANRAPTRKVRKVVRKVAPKGTIATREAAAAGVASAAAGALQPGEGHAQDKPPTDRNAAEDEVVGAEQSLGETAIKEPAAGCNSIAVREAQLVKEMVTDCGDAPVVEKLVSRGEGKDEAGMSEWQRRRKTEVFVGGLNRDAKEEDVRAVLAEAGEIAEVRMIMDSMTKKNKGYCFVRYHEAAQARKAIAKFGNVKICGKLCRVVAPDRNDKIFLGNIDKKWKKKDIMKLLQKIGVENIDVVTLMADCNNPGYNHGFAFLELETYRDAQIAYKKLSKKDVFGKGLNIRVAWAEPLDDPDKKQMQKVKAVFVEGVPISWDQAKMKEIFKKYGKIELVVLSRDLRSKRNDFAFVYYTTHEAAVLCLESFDAEQLTENGSKVNIKVSLAKSDQKGKKNIEDHKCCISEKDTTKIPKSERKLGASSLHILPSSSRVVQITRDEKSSTTNGLLHVLRELAPWRHEHIGSAGSPIQDYPHIYSGEKRPFSALGNDSYCTSRNPRAQHESSTYAMSTSSYGGSPHAITGYFPPYHHDTRRCLPDSDYGLTEPWGGIQMWQASSRKPGQPRGSSH